MYYVLIEYAIIIIINIIIIVVVSKSIMKEEDMDRLASDSDGEQLMPSDVCKQEQDKLFRRKRLSTV